MRSWGRIPMLALIGGIAMGAPPLGFGRHAPSAEELKAKILHQKNPIKQAKLQTQLARVVLQDGIQAYDRNDFSAGRTLLGEYLREAQTAWETLKNSGRDAVRRPDGFKQLDLALGENERLLDDLRQRVAYPESAAIKKVETESQAIHGHVLDALFPGLLPHKFPKPAQPAPPQRPPGASR